jgi:hypothetical protein
MELVDLQVPLPLLVTFILGHITQSHHNYFNDPFPVPSAEPLFHRSMRYTADHGVDRAGIDDISMRTPNR